MRRDIPRLLAQQSMLKETVLWRDRKLATYANCISLTRRRFLNVRDATARDAAAINLMICELAAYEDHAGELEIEVEQLVEALLGETPRLRAAIAESSDGPVGFFTYTIDFAIWDRRRDYPRG